MQIKKYKLLEKLGEGGDSEVFLVEDQVLHKMWVMKKIWKEERGKQEEKADEKEMELLKNLSHPAIPRVVDYFYDEKAKYYILDYIPGETLRTVMNQEKIKKKQIDRWLVELMEILAYLHSREPAIIYGDLKPENIIVGSQGKLSLIDFGAARKETETVTKIYGTKGYAAPEQYGGKTGKASLDVRSDLYSLGQVFYELFTGKLYVEGESDFKGVPRDYRMFLKKALEQRCEKRYPCIKTMQQERKRFVEKERKRKIGEKGKILFFPVFALFLVCMSVFFQSGRKVALSDTKDQYEEMLAEADQCRMKGNYEETFSILSDCIFQYPEEEDGYIKFFSLACMELRNENVDYMAEEIIKNADTRMLYREEVAYGIGTYYVSRQKYQKAYIYFGRITDCKEGSNIYYLKEITDCFVNYDVSLSGLKKNLQEFQEITLEETDSSLQKLQFQMINQVVLTYFKEDASMLSMVIDNCEWMKLKLDQEQDANDLFLCYEQSGNALKELGKQCKPEEKEKKMIYFEDALEAYFKAIEYSGETAYGMEGKLCEIGKLYHSMREYEKENEIYFHGIELLEEQANELYCVCLNSLVEQYQEHTEPEIKNKIKEVIETGKKQELLKNNQRWNMLIQTAKERGIYEEEQE